MRTTAIGYRTHFSKGPSLTSETAVGGSFPRYGNERWGKEPGNAPQRRGRADHPVDQSLRGPDEEHVEFAAI